MGTSTTFRNSIMAKLIALFLAVVLPAYLLSLAMNETGSRNVKAEIQRTMNTQSTFYLYVLESELERVYESQKAFVADDDLHLLSAAGKTIIDYGTASMISRVYMRLGYARNASRYIANAGVYIPALGHAISANSIYDDVPENEIEGLEEAYQRWSGSPIVAWEGRLFFVTAYPDVSESRKPNFLLFFELSQKELARDLQQFKVNDSGGSVLVGHNRDWMISSTALTGSEQHIFDLLKREPDSQTLNGTMELGRDKIVYTASQSKIFDFSLLVYTPESKISESLRKYNVWFWIIVISSVSLIILFSYWLHRIIHRPLMKLVTSFRKVEKGQLDAAIVHRGQDEFHYIYVQFNSMLERLGQLIHDNYEQTLRSQKAELKQLQSQINPHFLYNCFFILYQMAEAQDYENLLPYVRSLGEYFRYVTRSHSDEVPLEQEVNFTRAYLDIQKIRFGDRVSIHFDDMPDRAEHLIVPRLTLQPVVENAFKHGLEPMEEDWCLAIRFHCEPGRFVIRVEDSGKGMNADELESFEKRLRMPLHTVETTGLINVHHRLNIRYGDAGGIEVASGEQGGLCVEIRIPLEAGSGVSDDKEARTTQTGQAKSMDVGTLQ